MNIQIKQVESEARRYQALSQSLFAVAQQLRLINGRGRGRAERIIQDAENNQQKKRNKTLRGAISVVLCKSKKPLRPIEIWRRVNNHYPCRLNSITAALAKGVAGDYGKYERVSRGQWTLDANR